ncbi:MULTISPECIES: hypothetical protein [unclassified Chamaesiphon]|uniref:hypothetical protein n=1 Tax=unclassified Chamaesiphon TaxID=2620921 RepID=UPI00286CE5DD|nr:MULTISPECIES: hypothetical protein [unclassified Chamaesiphon]
MSIQQTTIKASTLLTALCLSAALAITGCTGDKKAETTTSTTTTETTPATTPATAPATTPATTPATGAAAPTTGAATALSATEKTQLTAARTALVMTNSAVKGGDMAKVKTQFEKFSGLLPAVEPILKAKAGASYPAITSGLAEVKTAMTGDKLDAVKAQAGLNSAIKAMTTVIEKK